MTNNNLPQEWIEEFEKAGVSKDGWIYDKRDKSLQYSTDLIFFEIDSSGVLYLWAKNEDSLIVATSDTTESIQLADRLKRASLNEPNPRVAELEAINQELKDAVGELVEENKELCDALVEALKDQERVATRASFDNDWEAESRADKRVAATKAILAKARGKQS